MVENAVKFTLKPEAVNREHASLQPRGESLKFNVFKLESITPDRVRELQRIANEVSPDPISFKAEEIPQYLASVVTSEEPTVDDNFGIISLPGLFGTGPGGTHVIKELFEEARMTRKGQLDRQSKNKDANIPDDEAIMPDPKIAIHLSSSRSRDTADQSMPADSMERVSYQAAYIAELLRADPPKALVIMGHSMGGLEAAYLKPMLERVLKEQNIPTEVKALVMVQAAGEYDQKIASRVTLDKLKQFGTKESDSRQLWPTPLDIQQMQEQKDVALEKGDVALATRLEGELTAMMIRSLEPNLPFQNEDEKTRITTRVREIDHELSQPKGSVDSKDTNGKFSAVKDALEVEVKKLMHVRQRQRLLQERNDLLGPIVGRMEHSADAGSPDIPIAAYKGVQRLRGGFRRMPIWLREKINDVPMVHIRGKKDVMFGSDEARNAVDVANMKERNTAQKGIAERAESSQVVADVEISQWSHRSPVTNPRRFAEITIDTLRRVFDAQAHPNPSEKRMNLYYSAN